MLINVRVNPMELNEAIVSECIMVHFFPGFRQKYILLEDLFPKIILTVCIIKHELKGLQTLLPILQCVNMQTLYLDAGSLTAESKSFWMSLFGIDVTVPQHQEFLFPPCQCCYLYLKTCKGEFCQKGNSNKIMLRVILDN